MLKEIEVAEALKLLLDVPVKLEKETVPIGEALGRVSAEDVTAAIHFPPFDRSPFDGYAFNSEDIAVASRETPVTLAVNQEIPAGFTPKADVGAGRAAKILTGAPIPEGADAVVKFEDTEFTKETVTFFAPAKADSNIVHKGEDTKAGTKILAKGTEIAPAMMGLLASQGLKTVEVYRRPMISVINTGNELAELGQPLPDGMIYNSSMFTLRGFIQTMGADFRDGGIVWDDEEKIAARVRAELTGADIVITTGGASVGDYDCARAAAEHAGADILFWKVRMRPGGSLLAYVLDGKLVLALSGNPGAAVLGLLLLGMPCVRKRRGLLEVTPEECRVRLAADIRKGSPKKRIMRGFLEIVDGEAYFVENKGQGGGDISSFVNCDLLAEIPASGEPLPAGTCVKAFRVLK